MSEKNPMFNNVYSLILRNSFLNSKELLTEIKAIVEGYIN